MDQVVKASKPETKAETETETETEGAAPKAAPRFIGAAPVTKEYHLKFPMEWDGQEYHKLLFSPLKGKSFSALKMIVAMGVSDDIAMLHLVTGAPVEVIDAMHADDYIEATEMAENFIPSRFLEKTSSESETGQSTQQ